MNMKKCEETMKEMAGNPSEDEMKGLRVFGLPAVKFTKKVLLYAIFYLLKQQKDKSEEYKRGLDLMTSLRR